MSLPLFDPAWMTEEHRMLPDSVGRCIADKGVPRAAEFRAAGKLGPGVWREAAANGLLCVSTPEAYGGGDGDFSHDAVILLEQARAGRDAEVHQGTQGLWQDGVGLPEHPLQAGRGAESTVLAAHALIDACMVAHLKGELDPARAALTKSWVSEQQCKVMDECLQLFGGYSHMMEYPIAELFVDARVQRIYGGTNEIMIMKELAARFM
jgi:alkylation response protein AidB-like acyl-CoA dehydrogenase